MAQVSESDHEPDQIRHPFVVYTLARIGLLIGFAVLCYLLGARGILLIVLAFVLSGLMSFVVLRRPRAAVGDSVSGYFSRINQRIEASKTAEDEPPSDALNSAPDETAKDISG